jgi:signal peptidase I
MGKENKKNFRYYFREYGSYVIVIIAVLFIKNFLVSPVIVSGESMESTLHDNDIMILNKISLSLDKIRRFDIVVVNYQDRYLIKRVIGLPGEEVEFKDNKLYINGEYVKEDFLDEDTVTKDFKLEGKVPDNFYFVVGDNRGNSNDSRYLGCFSFDKIEGKTSLTIFPFTRFGNKK